MSKDDTQIYFETLFGNIPDGLFILVWTWPDKRSYWCKDAEVAARTAATLGACGQLDVYAGVGLSDERRGKNERCSARDVVGLVGLWADIDVAGPAHKKISLPPTLEAASAFVGSLEAIPSLVVHSGHGIQAYWLFREPWIFESDIERGQAARLTRAWDRTIQAQAQRQGWTLDSVGDLARILRVPGTTNWKVADQPAAVRLG